MDNKKIEFFIKFLLGNKTFDHLQKREVSQLLARDSLYIPDTVKTPDQKPEETSNQHKLSNGVTIDNIQYQPTLSDTKTIYQFLHLFGEKEALKYTTHIWDKKADQEGFIYADFDEFKKKYTDILNDWSYTINKELNNTKLWMLIQNFLLNDDAKFFWSEYEIYVGYNKYIAQWMKDHPGRQPMSMPLSEYPDKKPSVIEEQTLDTFKDIVEIFKKCIEFRGKNFFTAVKKEFDKKPFKVDKKGLESLKGVTFYTHTIMVKDALKKISANMRPEYPNIEITCEKINSGKSIQLNILQKDSYSFRDIDDPKVLGKDENGDFYTLKELLRNLCDFAVESKFKVGEEFKGLHIDYLTSSKDNQKGIYLIPEQDCLGFKYILTFHTYN